jgi:hypothetical protein
MKVIFTLFLFLCLAQAFCSENGKDDLKKVCRDTWCYYHESLEGWNLFYSESLISSGRPGLLKVREQVAKDLAYIKIVMPKFAIKSLQSVEIYLNSFDPQGRFAGGVYHYSREVLIERGVDPGKFQGIEIYNINNFLKWKISQPGLILHELGHAYIHQFMTSGERQRLKAVYELAMAKGIYEDVPYFNGTDTFNQRAYATKDYYEFFCEVIEAYFWKNDYYPFNKDDLYNFDPETYYNIEQLFKLWP